MMRAKTKIRAMYRFKNHQVRYFYYSSESKFRQQLDKWREVVDLCSVWEWNPRKNLDGSLYRNSQGDAVNEGRKIAEFADNPYYGKVCRHIENGFQHLVPACYEELQPI